ncbi:eukaryotic translation initiation factor 2D [Cylas formicarius]|uniref:eukaryotic translation initiation factor 2D n=1 Tax=Cylas formicarius TaxID=197179 RepID=UPI002958CC2A|nr:eukaryotic translation initiation factor 2D [Cylas formicarius]
MFKKPIRIKSNNPVKGSERKSFKDKVCASFKTFTEAQANDLLHKKEVLYCAKVVTHKDEVVQLFVVNKVPFFFSVGEKLFPTIYLLWKYPDLIYSFTTHPQVFNFITSGADLMLPGIITPPLSSGISKYGHVSEGSVVSVNLSNNKAPIAVGVACQDSDSMIRSHGRGKCVTIYHFYGDNLCVFNGISSIPIPNMGTQEWLSLSNYNEDFPQLSADRKKSEYVDKEKLQDNTNGEVTLDKAKIDLDGEEHSHEEEKPNHSKLNNDTALSDDLLNYCFLCAIKYSKNLNLPILVSNFYKLQMLPSCPPDKVLDIKQSSYKKLKPFIDEMCKLGLITVKEIKKGVEAITEINKNHPKFNEFYINPVNRPKEKTTNDLGIKEPHISESYIVTQNVLPLFQQAGYRKGDTIQGSTVRMCVTDYIKKYQCQDLENTNLVKPKEVLQIICRTESAITWEEVFERVCDSMKNCFKVVSGNEQIFNKGKISPITMNVSVRSYNKKVTLVDNLELFGINVNEFSKECQHGVAASTTIISKTPGKKSDQLLVQGNQVIFIHNLLVDKYKIPKKFVKGLENAPKRKK